MKFSVMMLAVALIASVFAAGQGSDYPKPQVSSAKGQLAPDFTLEDQGGRAFTLSQQQGHWLLLYFYRGYW